MTATIIERFTENVAKSPADVALRYKSAGEWTDITWAAYDEAVRRAGRALLAEGFGRGDKISLLSGNRPEWHIVDVACMSLGGATAAIYATSSPEQVAYIAGHSDSSIAFVDSTEQLEKLLKVRAELPNIRKVVVFDGVQGDTEGFAVSWESFLAGGSKVADERFDQVRSAVTPDDVATFVYTSGTTGPPKAVMLTHANIWWTCESSERHIPIPTNGRALSYLPLSHIAERMISHLLQIYYGTQTWFAESIETLVVDLQACRPTYFFGVPRVWEKFYAGIQNKLQSADPNDRKVRLAYRAIDMGRRVAVAEQEAVRRGGKVTDSRVGIGLRMQHALLDRVVLSKIREALGLDRCELALSAAAPLGTELIWFFHSIGIKICEGYGQSEDNGPTTWNPPDAIQIGTVGTPLSGVEVKIAQDGEILVKGGNVMRGYYKDDEATRGIIDAEGWMHSGDVGDQDELGYVTITDRKKDLIITAGGKNIAPQEIENRIKLHDLVSQAVVIGDGRPFLTALITLDEEAVLEWANRQGIDGDMSQIASHERTLDEIGSLVDEVNSSVAKVERVRKFRVLTRDFLEEEDEITPTLKVKRRTINQVYAEAIEEMYDRSSSEVSAASAPRHT